MMCEKLTLLSCLDHKAKLTATITNKGELTADNKYLIVDYFVSYFKIKD